MHSGRSLACGRLLPDVFVGLFRKVAVWFVLVFLVGGVHEACGVVWYTECWADVVGSSVEVDWDVEADVVGPAGEYYVVRLCARTGEGSG